MQFTSRIARAHANVKILASRLQWTIRGRQHVVGVLPIRAITSVTSNRALLRKSTLTVVSKAGALEFHVPTAVAQEAESMLRKLISQQDPPTLNDDAQLAQSGTIADELQSLEWLRDIGLLSAIEFGEQTEQLLGFRGRSS